MLIALTFSAVAHFVAPQEAAAKSPELLAHAELDARMRALAAEHPELCSVIALGRSRAGREILALRLARGEPPHGQPAILLVANLDGPQVFTSAIALWIAEAVARGGEGPAATLLADSTLYVVPRLDPDAAEARFAQPLAERRASGRGADDDRDGRDGEDGPSDVNGDGLVTQMRVPDPDGEWTEDPNDPRALVVADAKKGETGRWKLFGEGRDLDRDEAAAEDDVHDACVNLNFPYGFREHDPRSGLFATDEPAARALCDFVLAHRDIALVVALGEIDTLVEKPKVEKEGARGLSTGWVAADAELMAELGRRYAKLVGGKAKGWRGDEGSFQGWAYAHRGLFVLALCPWDIPVGEKKPESAPAKPAEGEPTPAGEEKPASEEKPAGEEKTAKDQEKPAREPSDDAKRLKWLDANGESARFVAWTAFEHPELGAVEIGGFAPYARSEPPEKDRAGLAQKELEFLGSLPAQLPRVLITEFTAKDLGGGLLELEAALSNASLLPLSSAAARRNSAVRPARAMLRLANGAALVAGNPIVLVEELEGSGGRRELRWIVSGARAEDIELVIDTDHAGTASARPEMKS